ncbi:MAG TPA: ATP-dependent helicase, partial [Patescibacteria group bacterium]
MFTKDIFKTKFDTEYGRLNQEQKQAVDTIEGPVMVIAGAGTGKTQTIALRIANILLKTQTPPGAILCLTFTENAAINMRQRLISIIGQQAYRIKIHTFHSFCNEVILSNPQNFIFASEVEPLDELGRIEIIQNLIENLPNGAVLKPWGDHFYYQREIISRIQHLKRENVSPEKMLELVNQEQFFINQAASVFADIRSMRAGKDLEAKVLQAVENIAAIPGLSLPFISLLHLNADLYHQGQFAEGKAKSPAVNFKNYLLHFYDSQAKAIPKQTELQQIYLGYQQELKKRGVYDFDDMILFVLNAFKNDRELLLQYQEKFQYILVDEYQDTNSAQNQILDLLGSYFDIPNLFVVGDDDQSIFRFQGAAIENIFDFYQKYQANIKVVVLKNNYRSHQLILDTSQSVISNNRNRIANYIKNIDKSLVSVQSVDPDPVNVYAAPNSISENYFIVQKIKSLLDSGVSPQQIAVLYRNNSDITDLTEMMDISKLSYQLETGSDVLDNVHIRQLVNLLAYIKDPVDDALLFKVLSYPFLKINSLDLFKIVRYSHRHGLPLSDLIASAEDLANISPALQKNTLTRLRNFKIRLAKAKKWLEIYSLDKFFNKVIRRFGFLSYLLSLSNVEEVGCLKEFYSELKRLSIEENFNLTQFLHRLSLLIQNKLPLPVSPVNGDYSDSIRLMTVHKAKGLEFEHVFLIKVLDKKWGNNINTTSLPLPMGILKTEVSVMTVQDENEEERRLFYVALTRAKKQIYISYPVRTDAGRELMPSMFLAEIDPKLIQPVTPEKEVSRQAILSLFPLEESVFFRQPNLAAYLKHF